MDHRCATSSTNVVETIMMMRYVSQPTDAGQSRSPHANSTNKTEVGTILLLQPVSCSYPTLKRQWGVHNWVVFASSTTCRAESKRVYYVISRAIGLVCLTVASSGAGMPSLRGGPLSEATACRVHVYRLRLHITRVQYRVRGTTVGISLCHHSKLSIDFIHDGWMP